MKKALLTTIIALLSPLAHAHSGNHSGDPLQLLAHFFSDPLHVTAAILAALVIATAVGVLLKRRQ